MALVALANKDQLCRIIVPKALLQQTAQVIQSRAGGLVGRVVRHIPFARRTNAHFGIIKRYSQMHMEILNAGGVMLCIPEHILSFKLSSIQKLADRRFQEAQEMMEVQKWLDQSSRDILDESDFTLSTKTQLIYPSGPQTAVDGHPHRWQIAQEVLSLVEGHVTTLQNRFPHEIEVFKRHEGYPILHFLHVAVENALIDLLTDDICYGRLTHLEFKDNVSATEQLNVRRILSGKTVAAASWTQVSRYLADEALGMKALTLLRGLISQRIILLCLKKRWNVQYGLHPGRVPMAVPFEAKGIPSQTAEYGHPDTAIVLTCLAFYQTGLSKAQMSQSVRHIMKSPDPSSAYETWIHDCPKLPQHLRFWNQVNPDDDGQIEELWSHLKYSRYVVNHHMNNFVFPVHAKQFGVKLQASGWDIPLFLNDKAASNSRNLTTGFSGTNDNKRMLPGTIAQDDLPGLLQTNAEVLNYLLEDRNKSCYQATDHLGRHLSEKDLLVLLRDKSIRVLIDSGAYILEMKNEDVASAWLEIDTDAHGAVYFNDKSQAFVKRRFQKQPMPLLASPFADNLKDCVVYLDEAHTRGTDLKLPKTAKGAVTLGLGQTKDHTVQGEYTHPSIAEIIY